MSDLDKFILHNDNGDVKYLVNVNFLDLNINLTKLNKTNKLEKITPISIAINDITYNERLYVNTRNFKYSDNDTISAITIYKDSIPTNNTDIMEFKNDFKEHYEILNKTNSLTFNNNISNGLLHITKLYSGNEILNSWYSSAMSISDALQTQKHLRKTLSNSKVIVIGFDSSNNIAFASNNNNYRFYKNYFNNLICCWLNSNKPILYDTSIIRLYRNSSILVYPIEILNTDKTINNGDEVNKVYHPIVINGTHDIKITITTSIKKYLTDDNINKSNISCKYERYTRYNELLAQLKANDLGDLKNYISDIINNLNDKKNYINNSENTIFKRLNKLETLEKSVKKYEKFKNELITYNELIVKENMLIYQYLEKKINNEKLYIVPVFYNLHNHILSKNIKPSSQYITNREFKHKFKNYKKKYVIQCKYRNMQNNIINIYKELFGYNNVELFYMVYDNNSILNKTSEFNLNKLLNFCDDVIRYDENDGIVDIQDLNSFIITHSTSIINNNKLKKLHSSSLMLVFELKLMSKSNRQLKHERKYQNNYYILVCQEMSFAIINHAGRIYNNPDDTKFMIEYNIINPKYYTSTLPACTFK